MSATPRIAVIGAGAWGTALAQAWALGEEAVTLVARDDVAAADIRQSRRSPRLPDATLSPLVLPVGDVAGIAGHAVVAFVTPAQSFADVAAAAAPHLAADCTILLCCKGIEQKTGRTMAEVARDVLPGKAVAVLSGPSFAHDVAAGLPTAVTLAADDLATAQALAADLSTPAFRLYASDDVAGVEAGGALKNVLALAVGAARGLSLGASAEAALVARGFAEMTRLAVAMDGRAETLAGLSGLGDLILTCGSPQSRNFAYGMALGRAEPLDGRPLAEGVATAGAALALAQAHDIDTPIVAAVCAVLDGTLTASEAVTRLLARPLKTET